MTRRPLLSILAMLCVLSACPSHAAAEDVWSEPFVGVRYLHRTTKQPNYDIHLCFIDLTERGNRLIVTTQDDRDLSTDKWAKKKKVQIATNGGMGGRWNGYAEPSGLTMGEGKLWTDVRHKGAHKSYGSFAEGERGIAFFDPQLLAEPEPWMRNIIIGTAVILKNGQPNPDMTDLPRMQARHPRTAVAATKDMKTLMMLVVDGRQKHSIGMTVDDMQKLFMEFGAWTALNFDGGGSTCMFMEGRGVMNKPSDGRPRRVSTHLGVFASKGKTAPKGQVKGFVKGSDDKPLAGAKVEAGAGCFDVSDESGYFHLSQVPTGEPTITVSRDGRQTATTRPKVEKGATREIVVKLEPLAVQSSERLDEVPDLIPHAAIVPQRFLL